MSSVLVGLICFVNSQARPDVATVLAHVQSARAAIEDITIECSIRSYLPQSHSEFLEEKGVDVGVGSSDVDGYPLHDIWQWKDGRIRLSFVDTRMSDFMMDVVYDGTEWRQLQTNHGAYFGTIHSRAIDRARDHLSEWMLGTLENFDTISVLENETAEIISTGTINGYEATEVQALVTVSGDALFRYEVALSPDLNWLPVRSRTYVYIGDQEILNFQYDVISTLEISGARFPETVLIRGGSEGEVETHAFVDNVVFNQGLDDTVFSLPFPKGTRVHDKTRLTTYTVGGPDQLTEWLDESLEEMMYASIEESEESIPIEQPDLSVSHPQEDPAEPRSFTTIAACIAVLALGLTIFVVARLRGQGIHGTGRRGRSVPAEQGPQRDRPQADTALLEEMPPRNLL